MPVEYTRHMFLNNKDYDVYYILTHDVYYGRNNAISRII